MNNKEALMLLQTQNMDHEKFALSMAKAAQAIKGNRSPPNG